MYFYATMYEVVGISQHYMCSREVNLTEEEKEILKAEGLPIPTTLPLTKVLCSQEYVTIPS